MSPPRDPRSHSSAPPGNLRPALGEATVRAACIRFAESLGSRRPRVDEQATCRHHLSDNNATRAKRQRKGCTSCSRRTLPHALMNSRIHSHGAPSERPAWRMSCDVFLAAHIHAETRFIHAKQMRDFNSCCPALQSPTPLWAPALVFKPCMHRCMHSIVRARAHTLL